MNDIPHSYTPHTENDVDKKICFGNDCFTSDAIKDIQATKHIEGNQIVASASAIVAPPVEARWDYHSEAVLTGPEGLMHGGLCATAERRQDGTIEFSFQGPIWEMDRATVRHFEPLGLSAVEIAYWFPLLTGLVRGAEVPGLTLDKELRPFLYAVPLAGLAANGKEKSLFVRDFGVASGVLDDTLGPILAASGIGKTELVWQPSVPKAWGVVFARDFVEAESLAYSRAQFTADLINIALRAGISHFDTRYDSKLLNWDVDLGKSTVALHPWILLLEQKNAKGWIRTIPLLERDWEADLDDGYSRISFFVKQFLEVSEEGDFMDQTGQRTLTDRERKLSVGIQRSLRWLRIASGEEGVGDQFMAIWISLESILNCLDYPGVFKGNRKCARDSIEQGLKMMGLPTQEDESLEISEEFVRRRVFQGEWPLRTKLAMFAQSCGIQLRPGDSELVRDLARLRGDVFHTGRNDPPVNDGQLRQLQYLIERLVVAASVCGYEDLEEETRHLLQFGEIGPKGGAAPLFLDGQRVPYTLRFINDEKGQPAMEFIIEGKVYSDKNADIGGPQAKDVASQVETSATKDS